MITKPNPETCTSYISNYVSQAEGNDLIKALKDGLQKSMSAFQNVSTEREEYSYADGKWTIKEVLGHLIDTERVFAYRALVFARKDTVQLPGYDENLYAPNANTANRTLADMLKEYEAVRMSTIYLFQSFSEAMLDYIGMANNLNLTPRILGWMIAGHETHHHNVLAEKYFKTLPQL